ncbi:MAG: glycoside hydrolase family 32 protein [Massiliimalia sp.]
MAQKNTLAAARDYEAVNRVEDAQRPKFHATAPVGWCNDPNGWCCYQNQYHLFCQYHPYSTSWGPMHWAHLKTTDFLHWEQLPCALAPDTKQDENGCFSGGAIEWDGKMVLLYTGVSQEQQDDGSLLEVQQQCLAVGDGIDFTKSAQNPVISYDMQPEHYSKQDFRDPYLFVKEGKLCALMGGRGKNGHGRLLVYTAETLEKWNFAGVVAENDGSLGSMWECPNLFTLEDRQFILISPQYNRQSADNRFHCGNDVVALVGHWNSLTAPFQVEEYVPIDAGFDFYAPQTLETVDGRRIMIGWMQNWDHCYPSSQSKWYGQMSLPRELFWKDHCLCQRPVRELDSARTLRAQYDKVLLENDTISLEKVSGRVLDTEIQVDLGDHPQRFGIRFACGDGFYTEVRFDFDDGILRLDRRHGGGVRDVLELKEVPLVSVEDQLDIRLVLDRYSAEIFLQNGRQVASMTLYDTPQSSQNIEFFSKGKSSFSVKAYDLNL